LLKQISPLLRQCNAVTINNLPITHHDHDGMGKEVCMTQHPHKPVQLLVVDTSNLCGMGWPGWQMKLTLL